MSELLGHELRQGRRLVHIVRVTDGGVVTRQQSDGTFNRLSAIDYHAICGRLNLGRSLAGGLIPWDLDKANEHHERAIEAKRNGWPDYPLDREMSYGKSWCTTCWSVYSAERMHLVVTA